MKKENTNTLIKGYMAPHSMVTDITIEGPLCSSFNGNIEGLGNSVKYVWGEEE